MRDDVLKKRYLQPHEDWEGLCRRVADYIAENEEESEAFFEAMNDCLFLPNTPALVNAGREGFSMSACFVLPIEDSMEGIFDAVKNTALIHKMGGGTGFDFSRLRPAGSEVKSTRGVASGPCSFIQVFDTATGVTKQGGVRRGANMGILRVDHPDILEFVDLKRSEWLLPNINISVAITNSFMTALKNDADYDLIFNGEIIGSLRAKEVWDKIVENAWSNGEPGVIFIDKVNHDNMTPHIGAIEATNPCGEQPLLPYEACVLGSINLKKHVDSIGFDWAKLRKTVWTAVGMLDRIIDKQSYPLPEIERMHKGNRKIGLGVMGWADALIKLKIPYNSEEAVFLAEEVMSCITDSAVGASEFLADEHGAFPNWDGSRWHERGVKVGNATLTTIAPTGSISIIAGCSSGIEPVFDFETVQKRADGEFKVLHPLYEEWLLSNNGRSLPPYFVIAKDVSVNWHIKMQAAFQKHTHNAVSKTVNLPNSATKQDVARVFMLAYEMGCKGVTVYRDGSRKEQVITSKGKAVINKADNQLPDVMDAKRVMLETNEGKVYFHITLAEDKEPIEIFIDSPVKSKYAEVLELFARMTSMSLRWGCPIKKVIAQLEKVQEAYGSVSSISGLLLRSFRKIGINGKQNFETCPDCSGVLVMEEGCAKCLTCGFTRC